MTRLLLALGPSAGGVGRHVRQLFDGYSDRGYDVIVTGPADLGSGALAGLGSAFMPLRLPGSWRGVRSVTRDLAELARSVDLIHVQGLRAGVVALEAARRARIPCVVELHNLVTRETGGRMWRIARASERLVGRKATIAIGISPEIAERLGSAAHLVLLGVDAPMTQRTRSEVRSDLDLGPDEVVAICVARLQPQKALHVLVEAAARCDAVSVLVAGDGPLRGDLDEQISRTHAPVRLLGHRSDVPDLLAAADIAVLSSAWEGVPFFLHEAAWTGLPLVGTDVGGTSLLIRDEQTGLLVRPDRPDLLAGALESLGRDADMRRQLGKQALAMEQSEFSTDAMLTAIEALYNEALSR